MCGIAGVYGSPEKALLEAMGRIQVHRGPDESGTFIDDHIGLVSRRLSIIDLVGGHQPMSNEEGTIWVVFNGEIYNFIALREELAAEGHKFRTRSDTEVLVYAYEEWRDHYVEHLNGMFAVALWDSEAKVLHLARDRIGIKPLYYARPGENFVFASELKALLLAPELARDLNRVAIEDYLARRFSVGDSTLFRDVRQLLPGNVCLVGRNGITSTPFWRVPASYTASGSNGSISELRNALNDSVQRQLVSDVPLGISLSGGVDSSCLTALATQLSSGEVATFTAGFGEATDELNAARKVAEFLETRHREVMISYEEMTGALPSIVWHLDEPVADPAILPTYFISKFGRKEVKVALLGEGSDELFGGYSHYKLGGAPFSLIPASYREQLYHGVNLIFREYERKLLLAGSESGHEDPNLLDPVFGGLPFGDAMMRSELRHVLPRFQLHRVDRMTMAHSLEARVPYLDDVVVSAAFGIPLQAKIRGFRGKVVLRRAMKDLLPRKVLRRRKRVFGVPIQQWMSEAFGEALETLFDTSDILRSTFREQRVRDLLRRSTWERSGRAAYKAWMLAMLDLWYRTFVERKPEEIKTPIKAPW